jgi:hypothetical protein
MRDSIGTGQATKAPAVVSDLMRMLQEAAELGPITVARRAY